MNFPVILTQVWQSEPNPYTFKPELDKLPLSPSFEVHAEINLFDQSDFLTPINTKPHDKIKELLWRVPTEQTGPFI